MKAGIETLPAKSENMTKTDTHILPVKPVQGAEKTSINPANSPGILQPDGLAYRAEEAISTEMTKIHRIWNIFSGLLILLAALLFFLDPDGGLRVATSFLSLTFMCRGGGSLFYYLTMTRHMVGGRTVLYRGMIYLDLWLFTSSLIDHYDLYLMIYLAGINAFTGLVEVLRSREEKSVGSPGWKYRAAYGGASLLIAVAVIVGCTRLHSIRLVVYVYAAGLVYKSFVRIASAFRRTAIVFVQ